MQRMFRYPQFLILVILLVAIAYWGAYLLFFRNASPQRLNRNSLWISGTAYPAGDVVEVLQVPVNTDNAVLTTRKYAGHVTLIVAGEGTVDDDTQHDALYWYSSTKKVGGRFYGFRLDDGPIDYTKVGYGNLPHGLLPDLNPQHKYQFIYWVGDEPVPLAFHINNDNVEDRSVFTITVLLVNLIDSPGR